ncbi:MAG: hypothetical protein A2Z99_10385 [Treponema sp. GWB1_62_6]|nr:MAG: hypothetical protein A2Y36_10600 [Treponema sp. GWA1_62_8]OHE64925.1 MAG: hypothetical protein A2Z99_10385 [Treponema sp. GWB1_62_6]OHE67001.1 MAG: hypothetical protein A2001_08130 [Treponema sp. GWC1_61_84]OHE70913.1 MAG: hypothetical protein A2413_13325 [Treponema sp. RIFOXYC1_FULL_61_9]HCM27376.1 hypothetical protein [Treponema sp.]
MTKTITTPIRFLLRYDPVILELVRRVRSGLWGGPVGASVQAAVASISDAEELIAGILLAFGPPASAHCSRAGDLFAAVLIMGSDFAITAEIVVAPAALGADLPFVAVGSLNCRRTLVDFRIGTERILSFAGPDSSAVRLPLAEGTGARYRHQDVSGKSGPVIVTEDADREALGLARRLLLEGRIG